MVNQEPQTFHSLVGSANSISNLCKTSLHRTLEYIGLVFNIWVVSNGGKINESGVRTSKWSCRLHRGELPSQGNGQWQKELPKLGGCPMRMMKVKILTAPLLDPPDLVRVSLMRNYEATNVNHMHDLDTFDRLKKA